MRIAIGFLLMCHGIQEDIWIINGTMPGIDILFYPAALIESIAGLLILIGWQTNWAAFISSGEMAAAYFKAHAPNGFLPINNHGEPAVFTASFFFLLQHRVREYGALTMLFEKTSSENFSPRLIHNDKEAVK